MALQKQTVQVPLGIKGLNTQDSPSLVGLDSALELQNGYVTRTGEIRRRGGSLGLGRLDGAGNVVGATAQLAGIGAQLVRLCPSSQEYPLYAHAPMRDRWQYVPSMLRGPCEVETRPIRTRDVARYDPDMAVANGITLMCWHDSAGSPFYSIGDYTSDASWPEVDPVSGAGTATRGRCYAVGKYLVFLFMVQGAGQLRARVFDSTSATLTPTVPVPSVTVVAGPAVPFYDAIAVGNNLIVAWANNAAGLSVASFNPATGVTGAVTAVAADVTTGLACLENDGVDTNVYVAVAGTADGVRVKVFDAALALSGTTTVDAGATSAALRQVCGYVATAVGGADIHALWDIQATPRHNSYVRNGLVPFGGAAILETWIRSAQLVTRPFRLSGAYADGHYVGIVYESAPQSYYAIVSTRSGYAGRVAPQAVLSAGTATGSRLQVGHLASVANTYGSHYATVLGLQREIVAENGTFAGRFGVQHVSIAMDVPSGRPVELCDVLYMPGGTLRQYDGSAYYEAGFPQYPEQPALTAGGAGGGVTPSSTYGYVVVFRYTDARGNVWRSAPSIPVSIALGAGDQHVDMTIPTLRLSSHAAVGVDVAIELYRTLANGAVYYLLMTAANTTAADTIAYADVIADTALDDCEMLYTTGGVLEHYGPPASVAAEVWQNRLWLISAEDRSEVYFSKEATPGLGLGFRPDFKVRIDGAYLTALARLDDKLILFGDKGIWALTGEGPNAIGQGGYGQPEVVITTVGDAAQRSIVEIPDGLLFQSAVGIYALTRGLGIEYVGAPVEAYMGDWVIDATTVWGEPQVRLWQSSRVLVYDWQHKVWGVYTGWPTVAAARVDVESYFASASAEVYREEPTGFEDQGWIDGAYQDVPYTLRVSTAWMQWGGVEGFQRVYALQPIADYKGAHTLTAQFYYDRSATVGQTLTFSVTATGLPELRPKQQKCSALRLVLSDGSPTGDTFTLTGFSATVGVKGGLRRRQTAERSP